MPPRTKTTPAGDVWGRGAKPPGRALWEQVRDATARALSHNVADERALLGGLVSYEGGPDLYGRVAESLTPADFAVPSHAWLFRLLGELVSQGKPTNLLAIGDELERCPGGVEVLTLVDVSRMMNEDNVSIAQVPNLADRVLEHARRRRLQEGFIGALELVTDGNRPVDEVVAFAAERIARVARQRHPGEELARWHVSTVLARMLERFAIKPVPVAPLPGGSGARAVEARLAAELAPGRDAAGWPEMGGMLGGWWPDTLAVLVGHTGRGKSSLALQAVEAAARAGAPVLYASMEMGTDELVARLIALRGSPGATWSALKRGAYTLDAVARAGARLIEDCPHLYLWAPDGPGRTVEGLQRMTRAVSAVAGNRPPLVVLDYVQRLATPASGSATEDRRGAVSDLSGRLRDLSRPGGMGDGWPGAAVLALSSTARGAYGTFASTAELRKATDLEASGKESGELEYDAPVLLCMTSDKPEDGADEPRDGRLALVRVVKNREGSGGRAWFRFEAARGRFVETDEPKETRAEAPRGGGTGNRGSTRGSREAGKKPDPSLAD